MKEKERERGRTKAKGEGNDGDGPALPLLAALSFSRCLSPLTQRKRMKKEEREGLGWRLALPSLPSALLAAVSHPSVQEREREKGKGKGEGKVGGSPALPCLPLFLSLSVSI